MLFYNDEKIEAIKPYPHVAETLSALRDFGLKPGVGLNRTQEEVNFFFKNPYAKKIPEKFLQNSKTVFTSDQIPYSFT